MDLAVLSFHTSLPFGDLTPISASFPVMALKENPLAEFSVNDLHNLRLLRVDHELTVHCAVLSQSFSAQAFSSSADTLAPNRFPGRTSAFVISSARAGASLPISLPPDVAKSTIFLPEKS